MSGCLFCRIIAGELPATIVYRDDDVVAFRDAHPQAPTHILVIPTRHIASVADTQDSDAELLGRLITRREASGANRETQRRLSAGRQHRNASRTIGLSSARASARRTRHALAAGINLTPRPLS